MKSALAGLDLPPEKILIVTKGQASPTSMEGMQTKLQPKASSPVHSTHWLYTCLSVLFLSEVDFQARATR